MATPTRPLSGVPLQDLAPSSTFLRQLLEEISGTAIPTVLRRNGSPKSTPHSRANSNGNRRSSSVWVGGSSVAQDARDKLRAADEARLLKTSAGSHDATPHPSRPILHLCTTCFDPPSPSPGTSAGSSSPRDPRFSYIASPRATGWRTRPGLPDATEAAHSISTARGVHLTALSSLNVEPIGPGEIVGTASPLIFCDVDLDMSETTSPTEPPTSAISETFTHATTLSDDSAGASVNPRRRSCTSVSLHAEALLTKPVDKRTRSGSATPEVSPKKMRTMTLPVISGPSMIQLAPYSTPWRRSIGGDNRDLVRDSGFTERRPAPVEHISSLPTSVLPELSSFRPQAVGPQGVRPIPTTPIRSVTRKFSTVEREPSPETVETPIYARSLHLIDSDISIYKQDHGEQWRESALCLHCFRRHGGFNKLREHGYEVCGRDEALESHYWESDGVDSDW
jgi:hypothetical protein